MRLIEVPETPKYRAVWEGEHTCEKCNCRFELDHTDRPNIIWWEERAAGCGFDYICPNCEERITVNLVDSVCRIERYWCEYPESPEYHTKHN